MTTLLVFWRELKALLRLPQTYAIAAAFLVLSGIFFVNILIDNEVPDLEQYYTNIASTLVVLVPIVAMRSFAEERRSGSLDMALTWPLPRAGLVFGKFAANTVFVWVLVSVAWLYYWLVGNVADIAASRTGGGYIGLLLMASAFSALALMVSARAPSPTAAAFLGFGLLLFLNILDFAPGWIGDSLREFGPSSHFAPFPRGVVYWADVVYFVTLTALGLILAVAALSWDRPGVVSRSLPWRAGAAVVAVGMWLAGSSLVERVGAQADLTAAKSNSISATTRAVIKRAGGPVRLTGFARPVSREAAELEALVRRYRTAGATIDLDLVDPDVAPAKARAAGVELYGQVLVELGERREVIESISEVALTGALHRLSGASLPRACFTIGHGETSITDKSRDGAATLAGDLRGLYYDVQPVALSVSGAREVLSGCTVVIVAGPRTPFLPSEAELLAGYLERDGRLVALADLDSPRDQLNGLVQPWGLSFGSGVVSDLSSLAGDPASVVSDDYPSTSPVLTRLRDRELPVVFSSSVPVEPAGVFAGLVESDGGTFTALVRSSPKSWVEIPGEGTGPSRLKGPFLLAALADHSKVAGTAEDPAVARTRIAAVGAAEVATNRAVELLGNREFVTSLVQWVARADDLIAAGRRPAGFYKLVLTERQKNRMIYQGIVFPAALLLLPLPVALLRLRRG